MLINAVVSHKHSYLLFCVWQVHLERDPQECFGALNVPSKLSVSNEARLEILRDLLNSELSMDTTGSSSSCVYTAAYFLGRHEVRITKMCNIRAGHYSFSWILFFLYILGCRVLLGVWGPTCKLA